MAGMGRYPKDDLSRRNRNERSFDWTTLPPEGRAGPAPKLPPLRVWAAATVVWWEDLWSTPQAVMWDQSGRTLHTLAILHHQLIVDGDEAPAASKASSIAGEMRQHEDRHGLTPKAMLQLRWRIGRTAQDGSGKVLHLVPKEVADRVAEQRLDPSRVPAKRAPKSEWVDWAVELGWERSTAERVSKAQLVEHCSSVRSSAVESPPASSSAAVGRLREAAAKSPAKSKRKPPAKASAKPAAKPKRKGRS